MIVNYTMILVSIVQFAAAINGFWVGAWKGAAIMVLVGIANLILSTVKT